VPPLFTIFICYGWALLVLTEVYETSEVWNSGRCSLFAVCSFHAYGEFHAPGPGQRLFDVCELTVFWDKKGQGPAPHFAIVTHVLLIAAHAARPPGVFVWEDICHHGGARLAGTARGGGPHKAARWTGHRVRQWEDFLLARRNGEWQQQNPSGVFQIIRESGELPIKGCNHSLSFACSVCWA
jgi:hypothetical protein